MATHEQSLADRGVRKQLGAYYTPPDVVEGLLDLSLGPLLRERAAQGVEAVASIRVLDPSCGTGNFLVAAARRIAAALVALGVGEDVAAATAVRCVRGIEIDAGTARRCRAELRAVHPDGGGRTIVQGDALGDPGPVPKGRFDLVVGNPPFLSQLASSTARTRSDADALRVRFGDAVSAYTDPAAVFVLAALEAARPDGGVVCLVEPLSFLSARDAGGVRSEALGQADLRAFWVAGEPVFDADVEVCAPVLVRRPGAVRRTAGGRGSAEVAVVRGRGFRDIGVAEAPTRSHRTWSGLLAAAQGLPDAVLATRGVLGDLASATADFRDQYYGLADAVVDQVEGGPGTPKLVTSGLLDPAALLWGERSCRFNKVAYRNPRVHVAALSEPLQRWAERRLVPKVLVATQTRVLEAVVDEAGGLLPSVPVISVMASPDDLWRIGALLCSPAVTLVAARRHLGAARNASALRLSASDLLALPLPADRRWWDRAATAFARASAAGGSAARRGALVEGARAVDRAFGLPADDPLLAWWEDRLPRGPGSLH